MHLHLIVNCILFCMLNYNYFWYISVFFIMYHAICVCIGKHDLVCTGNVIYLGKLAL